MGVAQIICIRPRLCDALFLIGQSAPRRLPGAVFRPHLIRLPRKPAMRVDQRPMDAGIDQSAVVVLAMDFDEFRPDGAQRLRGGGLIVDEGARAPIRRLHAAQHEVVVARKAEFARGEMGGVVGRQIEHRRHLPLLAARAHERGVAAPAERQHEGVEEDGFAGARLAGKSRQPLPEIEIERVDEHDVADGQTDEHDAGDSIAS